MSKNSVTKKLITTLALLTCLCGIGTLSVHAAPKAVSFNNNSKKITMFATQRKQLKVKLSGKYKKSDVVYSSSNKKVATVNKKGVVKALKKGNITVYAQIKGTSKKAKCKVKVFKNVKSIKVVGRKKHYYIGEQYQLNYKTTPKKTLEEITWNSSNDDVATISEDGLLTIKEKGKVKITVYSKETKVKKTYKIKTEEGIYDINSIVHNGNILRISLVGNNTPTKFDRIDVSTQSGDIYATFEGYTTIYSHDDNNILELSNDGSIKSIEDNNNIGDNISESIDIELTEEQKAEIEKQNKINEINSKIYSIDNEFKTLDYIGIKIATGRATIDEYKDEIEKMTKLADEKNKLENELNKLQEVKDNG